MSDPARIVVERRVEWPDTDAAGHHHHSAILKWMENAEGALLRALGRPELFGVIPRVHYEVDYLSRLWFGQIVTIELAVAAVGRSSATYEFTVAGPDGPAATGRAVVVHTDGSDGTSQPWDGDIRHKFSTAGTQRPERFQA